MKQFFSAIIMLLFSVTAFAQKPSLSPRAFVKSDNIDISYGQPSKRDRVIFGDLVPYGEVWRTGANEATEITFKKDAKVGGKPVKAGTYTLFTIPAEKEWTIILNSKLGEWGAYDYEKNKGQNVLEIKVPVQHNANVQEKLTFTHNASGLQIEWDQTSVSIPVSF